jgi:hypothetical protein
MPINFADLRGETVLPDDGDHVAWLDRGALVTTAAGDERLVSEWRDAQDPNTVWTSWNGFAGQGMSFTRDFLLGLGVDLSSVNDTEELDLALQRAVGHPYNVRVQGRQVNDRVFINTYVNGRAQSVQQALDVRAQNMDELGTDRSGLPPSRPDPAPPPDDVPWKDDKPPF